MHEFIPSPIYHAFSRTARSPIVHEPAGLLGNDQAIGVIVAPAFKVIVNAGIVQAATIMRNADSRGKCPSAFMLTFIDGISACVNGIGLRDPRCKRDLPRSLLSIHSRDKPRTRTGDSSLAGSKRDSARRDRIGFCFHSTITSTRTT